MVEVNLFLKGILNGNTTSSFINNWNFVQIKVISIYQLIEYLILITLANSVPGLSWFLLQQSLQAAISKMFVHQLKY